MGKDYKPLRKERIQIKNKVQMKNNRFLSLIEEYNSGEMGDFDKKEFETELLRDKQLRNETLIRKSTDEILEKQDIILLRNKLTAIERQRQSKRLVLTAKIPVYYEYAAVILGMVLIGSILAYPGKNLSGDEIINKYYKVYEAPTTVRSVSVATNIDFSKALEYYNSREYGKAAMLFSKIAEVHPKDMQSEFMSGLAKFGDEKYPEAKKSFVRVIDDNKNYFIENAKWYLAFCYVKTGEKEKAIKQFEIVKEEGGIYSKDARMILRRYR